MMAGIKVALAATCIGLACLSVVFWHTHKLNERISKLEGELAERTEETITLTAAIATSNAKVEEMVKTTLVLRESSRRAREHAQAEIKKHQAAIASIRRETGTSCESEAVRQRLIHALVPEQ